MNSGGTRRTREKTITTSSTAEAGFTDPRGARRILITLFVIYMLDYVDRMVVAGMLSYIKHDYHITDQQAGW